MHSFPINGTHTAQMRSQTYMLLDCYRYVGQILRAGWGQLSGVDVVYACAWPHCCYFVFPARVAAAGLLLMSLVLCGSGPCLYQYLANT